MNCDIDRTVPACALIARGIVVSSLEKTVLSLTFSEMASVSHVLRVALELNTNTNLIIMAQGVACGMCWAPLGRLGGRMDDQRW